MIIDHDDNDHAYCPLCGAYEEWVECWQCHGQGGWHECGEDCCPCLDKEEVTRDCDECFGQGGWLECTGLPHTKESLARYIESRTEEQPG